jgi:hypothetical protein
MRSGDPVTQSDTLSTISKVAMCAGADEIYIREQNIEVFDTESRDS